jgi:hypothetical protein
VVVDLFGVAWLLRRPLRYRVVQTWDAWKAAGEGEPTAAARSGAPGSRAAHWMED